MPAPYLGYDAPPCDIDQLVDQIAKAPAPKLPDPLHECDGWCATCNRCGHCETFHIDGDICEHDGCYSSGEVCTRFLTWGDCRTCNAEGVFTVDHEDSYGRVIDIDVDCPHCGGTGQTRPYPRYRK